MANECFNTICHALNLTSSRQLLGLNHVTKKPSISCQDSLVWCLVYHNEILNLTNVRFHSVIDLNELASSLEPLNLMIGP